eukprot:4652364-Pyramimonas_sp.AAC.4
MLVAFTCQSISHIRSTRNIGSDSRNIGCDSGNVGSDSGNITVGVEPYHLFVLHIEGLVPEGLPKHGFAPIALAGDDVPTLDPSPGNDPMDWRALVIPGRCVPLHKADEVLNGLGADVVVALNENLRTGNQSDTGNTGIFS